MRELSVCSGTAGCVDALLTIARIRQDPLLEQQARDAAKEIIRLLFKGRMLARTPALGFYDGL